ncbi:ABC transporter permease, partial [Kitasatospora sp. NPDC085895]
MPDQDKYDRSDPLAEAGTEEEEIQSAIESRTFDLGTAEAQALIKGERLDDEPEIAAADDRVKPRSLWQDAWRDLRRNPIFIISGLLIIFLVIMAIWPGLFTSTDPLKCDLSKAQQGSESGHPFGFDGQGCDVYARTVYGARASITVGVCATVGAALVGTTLGGLAGFLGGWSDSVISRVADIFFGIPILLGGLVFLSV